MPLKPLNENQIDAVYIEIKLEPGKRNWTQSKEKWELRKFDLKNKNAKEYGNIIKNFIERDEKFLGYQRSGETAINIVKDEGGTRPRALTIIKCPQEPNQEETIEEIDLEEHPEMVQFVDREEFDKTLQIAAFRILFPEKPLINFPTSSSRVDYEDSESSDPTMSTEIVKTPSSPLNESALKIYSLLKKRAEEILKGWGSRVWPDIQGKLIDMERQKQWKMQNREKINDENRGTIKVKREHREHLRKRKHASIENYYSLIPENIIKKRRTTPPPPE